MLDDSDAERTEMVFGREKKMLQVPPGRSRVENLSGLGLFQLRQGTTPSDFLQDSTDNRSKGQHV